MSSKSELHNYIKSIKELENSTFLVQEDSLIADYEKSHKKHSLAIKILSIFGGLLASLAFIGFIFMFGIFSSGLGLLILGTICLGFSTWINAIYDDFLLDTVSVSLLIISFLLIAFGFAMYNLNESTISGIILLLAVGVLALSKNFISTFISILLINGCLISLLLFNNADNFIHLYAVVLAILLVYTFLNEAKFITQSKKLNYLYNPLKSGLLVAFLATLIFLGKRGILYLNENLNWFSSVAIIALVLYLLFDLFPLLNISKVNQKIGIIFLCAVLLLPTGANPSIAGALLLLILCFKVNYKTGFVLSILSLIYFISQFYYDLTYSLLTKSVLLLSTGVLFLVLYFFVHKKLSDDEKL